MAAWKLLPSPVCSQWLLDFRCAMRLIGLDPFSIGVVTFRKLDGEGYGVCFTGCGMIFFEQEK